MFEVGRLCVKIAGRDAGKKCVIVEVLENNYVLIDGTTRRRKCNALHLEPLKESIKIKSKASHSDIIAEFKKLGIEIKETKPKKTPNKPKKAKVEKKSVKEKAAKEVKKVKAEKKEAVKPKVSEEKECNYKKLDKALSEYQLKNKIDKELKKEIDELKKDEVMLTEQAYDNLIQATLKKIKE